MYINITATATAPVIIAATNAFANLTSPPQSSNCESDCESRGPSGWVILRLVFACIGFVASMFPLWHKFNAWHQKRRELNRSEAREAAEDVELDSSDLVPSITQAMHLFLNPGLGPFFETSFEPVIPAATLRGGSDEGEEFPPPPYEEDPPPYHDFGTAALGQLTRPEAVHRA